MDRIAKKKVPGVPVQLQILDEEYAPDVVAIFREAVRYQLIQNLPDEVRDDITDGKCEWDQNINEVCYMVTFSIGLKGRPPFGSGVIKVPVLTTRSEIIDNAVAAGALMTKQLTEYWLDHQAPTPYLQTAKPASKKTQHSVSSRDCPICGEMDEDEDWGPCPHAK